MLTKDNLISEIKEKFRTSCPNGMLLQWDRNRFYSSFSSLFIEYNIKNQTDFNYSYCNSFDIEMLSRGDAGEFYRIALKISFIVDAYTVYLIQYSKNKKKGKVICEKNIEAQLCIEKIKHFMEKKGFQEINDEFDIVVPDVKLELAEIATVGKCLFDDF